MAEDTPRKRKKKAVVVHEFDPTRWVHVAFFAFFLMLVWMLVHLFEDAWDLLFLAWPNIVGRPQTGYAQLAGGIVSIIAYIYALRRKDWKTFVSEVAIEVSQIVWPTRAETRGATVVVITITLICSLLLAGMDVVWSSVTDWIYGI